MPFTHTTGVFNVKATLYAWLNERLIANQPPLLAGVTFVRDFPDPMMPSDRRAGRCSGLARTA